MIINKKLLDQQRARFNKVVDLANVENRNSETATLLTGLQNFLDEFSDILYHKSVSDTVHVNINVKNL